jgi:parallel beta-helix repeat protein
LNRTSGDLTYWPIDGETLDNISACYPTLNELVFMIGNYDTNQLVENISFFNLSFHHSDWYLDKTQMVDDQAAVYLNTSAIYITDARNIHMSQVDVQHVAYYAIQIYRASTDIWIDNCKINDIGAGGVRIGEMITTSYTTARIRLTNNFITDGGNVFKEGIGVLIHRSSDNIVDRNVISHFRYTGISVGWTWGYTLDSNAYRNMITNNRISHIGEYELCDLGGIYALGVSNGTVIRNNDIQNVHGYIVSAFGIYMDEGASYILVENNRVSNTESAGFYQHYGINNIIRNNYFDGSVSQDSTIRIGNSEDHLSFSFINNTVIHSRSGTPVISKHGDGASTSTKQFLFDYNTYYNCVPFEPLRIEINQPKHALMLFSHWQQGLSQDLHSKVVPCKNNL